MVFVWVQGVSNYKSPCPRRIGETTIHALFFGLIVGAVYELFSKIENGRSLGEAIQNALRQAPVVAIATGILMAVYTTFECTVEFARNREDAINCFIAGGLTGAVLGAKGSAEDIICGALLFGFLFGIMDVVL